jgi:hypothetical protein
MAIVCGALLCLKHLSTAGINTNRNVFEDIVLYNAKSSEIMKLAQRRAIRERFEWVLEGVDC